jgi:DNA uptake protein ComE-like DNA-binding protein
MRRGFVMLAVMIGLAMALIASAALLQLAQAETSGATHSVRRAQSHALARSGMEAIAGRLAEQRQELLAGRAPRLDEHYVIYEADGRLGVVRLLPIGPAGALIESESCKLDINEVSAEQLVATGLVEEDVAQRLVQFRDAALTRPIQSLSELTQVPGVTNELLFGSIERVQEEWAPRGADGGGSVEGEFDRGGVRFTRAAIGETNRALVEVLTVYSVEADVRVDGSRRIDLSVSRRVSEAAAEGDTPATEVAEPGETRDARDSELAEIPGVLRPLVARGATYKKASEIVAALRRNNVPADEWPEYFESCTTQPRELRHGRLDINTAPVEALLAVPGFTVEHAEAIAAAQETLGENERATVCWPLLAGIVEAEQFAEAIDHITNRSSCYRVRIAAGEVSIDEPDGPLNAPVIYEMVFDLASPAPRVAYLRDVTLLPTMLELADRGTGEASPLDDRSTSHALDDEIIAWDEQFGEEDDTPVDAESGEPTDGGADDPFALPAQPSLPSQPSLPDFPPFFSGASESDDEAPPSAAPGSGESASSPGSGSSSSPPPPLRRIGRWRGG